jgi:ankyrin repeat protein
MNNQQIAILQSIEAVLKFGLAAPQVGVECFAKAKQMRAELDAIFQHVSKLDREILLNVEFAPGIVTPPMWLAVQLGLHEVLAWLVQYGASPDGPDRLDQALLLSAIGQGFFASADALLALGADPKVLNKNGTNSVMLALRQGNRQLVEKLLNAGVPLDHINHKGLNALHFVAMSGDVALFEWVRSCVDFALNLPSGDGRMALHYCQSFELFERLRSESAGVDFKFVFGDGDQAVHDFCLQGQLEIVQFLLDQGIDVQASGQSKNTPLHYAVSSGKLALVRLLIARGAKVEARNKAGMRPLHWAADLGNLAMLDLLLSHKAKVKIKGNTTFIISETHSPLYLAAQNGHLELVRRLLSAGAEVNALNDASCRTALCAACVRDDLAMVELLLAHGASPNGLDSNKDRFMDFPLANARSAEMVKCLIDAGADVNAAGRYKDTALHYLAKNITELGLSAAVAAMPSVEACNPDCIRSRHQKHLAACAILLEHGASPFARDYGFKLPHEHATDTKVIALLQAARSRIMQSFNARSQLPELLAPLADKIESAIATDPKQLGQATRVHIVSNELTYSDLLLLQQSIEARYGPVVELVLVDRYVQPKASATAWNVFSD